MSHRFPEVFRNPSRAGDCGQATQKFSPPPIAAEAHESRWELLATPGLDRPKSPEHRSTGAWRFPVSIRDGPSSTFSDPDNENLYANCRIGRAARPVTMRAEVGRECGN